MVSAVTPIKQMSKKELVAILKRYDDDATVTIAINPGVFAGMACDSDPVWINLAHEDAYEPHMAQHCVITSTHIVME